MMPNAKRILAVLTLLCVTAVSTVAHAADKAPVIQVSQPTGQIDYSPDGNEWKPVTRTKLLFAGQMLRTGANGGAILIIPAAATQQAMGPNTTVKANDTGAEAVSGTLPAPTAAAGDLLAGLGNRFAEAQRYTTVRRGVNDKSGIDLKIAAVTASPSFPDIVWENAGAPHHYRVVIDGKAHPVAATQDSPVRFKAAGLAAGKHTYKVEVLDGDNVVAESEEADLMWLSDADDAAIKDGIKRIGATSPNDDFLIGNFFDEKGLTIPAMDHYRTFFKDNQDDNAMRPLLVRAYRNLKLEEMRKAEASLYNQLRASR